MKNTKSIVECVVLVDDVVKSVTHEKRVVYSSKTGQFVRVRGRKIAVVNRQYKITYRSAPKNMLTGKQFVEVLMRNLSNG